MKKRLTIGVITTECYRSLTSEMICGILAQSMYADCNIIVLSTKNNFQEPVTQHNYHETELLKIAQLSDFDGFIYDRNSFDNKDILKQVDFLLKRTSKPVMMIDAGEHPFFDNTVSNDSETFELLVEHMIQIHGYKKIYCLTGQKEFPQGKERLEAYCNVMRRHGLYYDESYYAYGDFWRNYPVTYAHRIISGELAMPEAVVCANDVMADALINALEKAGIRVPEDIAVTGFDGYLENRSSNVILTSCKKSYYQLGANALRRLYGIITGKNCRKVLVDRSRIQIGRSCGCIPVQLQTSKSRREKRLISDYREWFYQSDIVFDMIHTNSLHELIYVIVNRLYLILHWNQFHIFLNDTYLKEIGENVPSITHKGYCEVIWCDRTGKKGGILDRSIQFSELISDLTQGHRHPKSYFISPLHMGNKQFGYAMLSFGKQICCYQPEYCTFLSYLCVALEHLLLCERNGETSESGIENPQLYKLLVPLHDEMQQNPELNWSIQEICQRTNVSRSYLQRMYKVYFGKSVFEDLIYFRLKKAMKLLSETDLTISQIAEKCGYTTYAHFANQFKAHEGITPSLYREQHKK